jgi:hypothetical protein
MRLNTKRLIAAAGGLAAFGAFSRVTVLLLESVAAVRDERYRDSELLELCRSGAARESSKMRMACLDAQSDRASPLILKATLRAFSVAYADFERSISSPGKLLILVLFAMVSVFMPLSSVLKAILPSDDADGNSHVVVVSGMDATNPRSRFKRAMGALRMRKGRKSTPRIECPEIFEIESGDTESLSIEMLGHEKSS